MAWQTRKAAGVRIKPYALVLSLGVLVHPAVVGAFARARRRETGELAVAIAGGGRAADSRLATILTQGIPPEGAALPRERA